MVVLTQKVAYVFPCKKSQHLKYNSVCLYYLKEKGGCLEWWGEFQHYFLVTMVVSCYNKALVSIPLFSSFSSKWDITKYSIYVDEYMLYACKANSHPPSTSCRDYCGWLELKHLRLDNNDHIFSPLQMALCSHWNNGGWNQCNMRKYEGDNYTVQM